MTASSKPSVRMWWPSSVLGTKSRAPTSYTPPTLPGSVRCRARHRAWHCRPGEMGPPLPWSHRRTAARTAGALRVAVAFAQLRAARPALCFGLGCLQLRGHRMRVALSQSLRRVARPSEWFDRLLIVRSLVEPPPTARRPTIPVSSLAMPLGVADSWFCSTWFWSSPPPVHCRGSAGAHPEVLDAEVHAERRQARVRELAERLEGPKHIDSAQPGASDELIRAR